MLHNELEYRNAKKGLNHLRAEVEKRSLAVEGEIPENSRAVVEALEMKISDIEHEIAEYGNLKAGHVSSFSATDLDEFGDVVTKARIAKGWSQADLAEALGTHHQQIQRYERNDWQKINLWRLQEVVEALGLDVAINAQLHDHEGQGIEPSQTMPSHIDLYSGTVSNLGLGVGEALSAASVSIGEALGNVSVGISGALGTLPTAISDAVDVSAQAVSEAATKTLQKSPTPQESPEALQTALGKDWGVSSNAPKSRFLRRRVGTPATALQRS